MASILHLARQLDGPTGTAAFAGVHVRNFRVPGDVDAWLDLREEAFAHEEPGVRRWGPEDFEAEFLTKPWWRPERMWLAEVELPSGGLLVGSVTLAMRGEGPAAKPVVHWLMLLPRFRRRGIGRLLISTLEAHAWREDFRAVYLETHANWLAAARFYEALGYRPVR